MRFIYAAALAFFSLNLFAQCESGFHRIYLLHGIGGSKSTFGALEEILNQESPCNKAKTFEYKTGGLGTPYDFAKDFHQYVSSENPGPRDKISLVMHSQGGLVGTLWLKLLKDTGHMYRTQLNGFVTLSTPFWGTDIAYVGKLLFYTLPPGVINPISPFGRNELNEMSYGSGLILDLVRNIDAVFEWFPHLRPLIIAGMKKTYSSALGEDDVVVPHHSMRVERYYLRDQMQLFEKPLLVNESFFKKAPTRPVSIVDADHIRLGIIGVADIPKTCLKKEACTHPSLNPLLSHLGGTDVKGNEKYKLTQYRFTAYINNPQNLVYDKAEYTIEVSTPDTSVKVKKIDRYNPFLGSAKLEQGLAFSFGGSLQGKQKSKLLVTMKYKNKAIRTYEVPVEAGVSSFLDLELSGAH